jgi:hypothetical protein
VSRHGFASSTSQTIRASLDHVQICTAQQQAALQYRNCSYVCAFRDSRRPNLIAVHSVAVTTVEISVSIDRAPHFTTAGVLQLIHLGTKLRRVDFGYCPQLGDEVVLAVAQRCPLLQEFTCPLHTSDAAFVLLAESCPELTTAGFARTDISDTALVAIATYCKKITTVYMWGCKKITVEGVRALGLHCASLRVLMLPSHLSALEVESLKAQFPEVRVA